MSEGHKPLGIARRADHMNVFKGDPPTMKLKALRTIERNRTARHALSVVGVAALALLNYWPALAGWFRVAF